MFHWMWNVFLLIIFVGNLLLLSLRDLEHAITKINMVCVTFGTNFQNVGFHNKRNGKSQILISCLFCCWFIFLWMSVSSVTRYEVKNSKKFTCEVSRNWRRSNSTVPTHSTKSKDNAFRHFLSFNSHTRQKCWVLPSSLERYFNELDTQNCIKSELMKYEWARYETFKTFPMESPVMPLRLASNGFYYEGSRDVVKCFSCGLVHGGWKDGDSVSYIHTSLSPSCQFLGGTDQRNIEIHTNGAHGATGGGICDADSGRCSGEVFVHQQSSQDYSDYNTTSSGRRQYKYPKYASYQHRMASFSRWPCPETVEPHILAEAGYFYAGVSDCVRCFSCGGGLRNWEYGDGPWEEHARWFHWCSFLREQKGLEFIHQHREVETDSDDELVPCSTAVVSGNEAVNALKRSQGQGKHKNPVNFTNSGNSGNTSVVTAREMNNVEVTLREMGFSELDIQGSLKRTGTTEIKESTITLLIDDLVAHPKVASREETQDTSVGTTGTKPTHGIAKYSMDNMSPAVPKTTAEKDSLPKSDQKSLHDENSKLKNQLTCRICMDKESNIVFIPCGHIVSCGTCAPNLRKCAICRQPIKGRVKAFMT